MSWEGFWCRSITTWPHRPVDGVCLCWGLEIPTSGWLRCKLRLATTSVGLGVTYQRNRNNRQAADDLKCVDLWESLGQSAMWVEDGFLWVTGAKRGSGLRVWVGWGTFSGSTRVGWVWWRFRFGAHLHLQAGLGESSAKEQWDLSALTSFSNDYFAKDIITIPRATY